MIKKIIWVLGLLGIGFVIFNNFIQTIESIKQNLNYLVALVVSLIGVMIYGLINIKN